MESSASTRRVSPGRKLLISASVVEQFANCPICRSAFVRCCTTPCGHRFCEDCIGRHLMTNMPRCPCCNSNVTANQLIKDHQFDALIGVFEEEKKLAQDRHFDETFTSAASPETASGSFHYFSPIHAVLKDYVKECFLAYESYYQDLKDRHDKVVSQLDQECKQRVDSISPSCPDRSNVIKTIERTFEERKEQLEKELKDNVHHIANSYKDHLQRMPELKTIPFKVSVVILCKDMTLPSVLLEPHAKLDDIKAAVEKAVNGTSLLWECNPISEWGDDTRMVALGLFSSCDGVDLRQIAADVVAGHFHEGAALVPLNTPLLNLGLRQISHILVHGKVLFESDQPQRCFSETFIDTHSTQDYFTCHTCGTANWICRSCKLICHAGHNVKPYILGHNPGWACCYCTKTKRCLLQRKT